jgi:hypothetical protein
MNSKSTKTKIEEKLNTLKILREHLYKKIEKIGNKPEVKIYLAQLDILNQQRLSIYKKWGLK